jgi:hypothetical protein
MMNKLRVIALLLTISVSTNLFSQSDSSKTNLYKPVLFGILKTKAEYDLENLKVRFEVRNARFGAKRMINQSFGYKAEIDLSDEGKLKTLEVYLKFSPVKGLDFYMGQKKIPFSTDYLRNPAENFFANRSFIAKYIDDGLRDIGFFANYRLNSSIPFDIWLGAANGTGNNNPQWVSRPNLIGRVVLGKDNALRIASNAYFGQGPLQDNLAMFGQEVRFVSGPFMIESEFVTRNWTDTLSARQNGQGFYLHSFYNVRLRNTMVKYITPTARWDWMKNSTYEGDESANRMTFGLNFGFEAKQFTAEIRLNYENYFTGILPVHTDKLTLEFVGVF